MDRRNLPPMTMPTIVPTSEDFFGAGGTGAPEGVVLIVPVGVGVPVDSGAATTDISECE